MSRKHKQFRDAAAWWYKCLIFSSFTIFASVGAFNLEFRQPIVKKEEKGSYFGYSVAQHIDNNKKPW